MPRVAKQKSQAYINKLIKKGEPGLFAVGYTPGLALQIKKSKNSGKIVTSWIYRVTINGKRRSFGLGSTESVSLEEARKLAKEMAEVNRKLKNYQKIEDSFSL